ncbi:alpha/beta hydrolase [Lapillicoccus jejuensis]|uniref:Enterochelin esterase family protein n=1 Tax=Lapillicoccus jejuensis TaxID=402171 RepID=A0A542E5X0_9MICO|nr:alpha/beta hydrolase-fold protein [Lapillicoccus jejuensis]TQJ10735.1 enterochelin esterase family protein [Lapillicoccus jejuensis]
MSRPRKLAVNRLRERVAAGADPVASVDRFLARRTVPVVEGRFATFVWRGEADEVMVRHRVVGLPDPLRLKRMPRTDLWWVSIELPEGSRVEYQYETVRGGHREEYLQDPLNPRVAHGPFGASSVCAATGYVVPDWTRPDPEARPGEVVGMRLRSRALRREQELAVYLPARFRRTRRYPLLVVHDGYDYLDYAAARTVLDNLVHRDEVESLVVAFVPPGDRLVEYANHAPHARFVARELVPFLGEQLPLVDAPRARTLLGSSFGGIASLSTAVRYPGEFGALVLQSASMVFTDIGDDHGGGPAFDPVVRFVNAYRARPRRVVERIHQTCGVYEPLITPNRSMVQTFRDVGTQVRYAEARDGHNWENWRDRLRDALTWVYPGEQKFVYE